MWSGRALGTQWQGVMIANAHADDWRHLEGRTVADLAAEAGCDPSEMALDILRHTDGSASVVCFSMSEDNLVRWLRLPFVAVGSDGTTRGPKGPTAVGKPHPRSFGTWSRFLGSYVRDKRVMPLREAIRRITSLPASRMGLATRGVLTEGACADITVFDFDTIHDRATYQDPLQCSVGVRHVLVNGQVALRDGQLTPARAGRFLRRGDS
jgi:N-acyl-D-amino-acid deacylase